MNFLRRLIRRAFPEAGMPYNSLRWPAVPNSPNPAPSNDPISRSRAEAEVRNSALAKRIVSAWSGALCGGNSLTPMLKDPQLRRLWDTWERDAGCQRRAPGWVGLPLIQIVETGVIVSGECFVQLVIDENAPGIPLALQALPPEYLDTSKSDGSTVVSGIAFNGTRRSGYWLYESHPAIPGTDLKSVFVPASDCLHVYRATRPAQQRGESWFLPVLYLLRLLREYLEADLTRQKTSALMAGFIRSPSGTLNPFATAANPNGSMKSRSNPRR